MRWHTLAHLEAEAPPLVAAAALAHCWGLARAQRETQGRQHDGGTTPGCWRSPDHRQHPNRDPPACVPSTRASSCSSPCPGPGWRHSRRPAVSQAARQRGLTNSARVTRRCLALAAVWTAQALAARTLHWRTVSPSSLLQQPAMVMMLVSRSPGAPLSGLQQRRPYMQTG
jgi:hypothetical protein